MLDNKLNYNELILSSGGIKGGIMLGALDYLSNVYDMSNFKFFTGCSVGAFICFMLCIGYNPKELYDIFINIDESMLLNISINNLLNDFGLDNFTNIINFFKAMMFIKEIDYNITFKELYEKTGKLLTIVVTNISENSTEYFNNNLTPDANILNAIRMSISIPILTTPVNYNNNLYVDGALLDPYPYNFNKDTVKFGLWVLGRKEYDIIFSNKKRSEKNNIVTFDNYFNELIMTMWISNIKYVYKTVPENTIVIIDENNTDVFNLRIDKDSKIEFYKKGYSECEEYFFKLKNIDYLEKKYYNLWKNKINK
jgi:predicted patatin/cPLA2 family phospholipase